MPASLFRLAARGPATFARAAAVRPAAMPLMARVSFSTSMPRRAEHAEETFEEFTAR